MVGYCFLFLPRLSHRVVQVVQWEQLSTSAIKENANGGNVATARKRAHIIEKTEIGKHWKIVAHES